MPAKIIPAILTDNLETFASQIQQMEGLTDLVQIDVADGQFVPTKTLDAEEIKSVSTTLKYELHLMVARPSAEIDKWYNADNIERVIFHFEATPTVPLVINQIEEGGRQAGLAINPDTPLSAVESYFPILKYVLVMSVMPGRQGQAFIPEAVARVKEIKTKFPYLTVAVDGGINAEQIPWLLAAGADNLNIGSAIFAQPDPRARLLEFNKLI